MHWLRRSPLGMAILVITSLLMQATTPVASYAAPAAAEPVPATWCPSSGGEAATVLSQGKGSWNQLPRDGRTFDKWKLEGSEFVDLNIPHTADGAPVGSFDHWKAGNGIQADITYVDSATFNCPANGQAGTSSTPAQQTAATPTGPANALPTTCPKDGWEASLLTDGAGTWKADPPKAWRPYTIWNFTSDNGKPYNVWFPGFGHFEYFKEPGPITHNVWAESVSFHCQ